MDYNKTGLFASQHSLGHSVQIPSGFADRRLALSLSSDRRYCCGSLALSHDFVGRGTMRPRSRFRGVRKRQSGGVDDAIVSHQRNWHLGRLSNLKEQNSNPLKSRQNSVTKFGLLIFSMAN